MADRLYYVECASTDQATVVAVDVDDGGGPAPGAGNPVHGYAQWGAGIDVPDGNGNPSGRVNWGWWEYQWLGVPGGGHPNYGWQTLAALQALNPGNDPSGIVVTFEDVT